MIKLRRILNKKPATSMLQDIADGLGAPISVYDPSGKLLFGPSSNPGVDAPLVVKGDHLGTVRSDVTTAAVAASALDAYIGQEVEKLMLSNDTLNKYNELSLLYEVAPRLLALRTAGEVATQLLRWACDMIDCAAGVVVFVPSAQKADSGKDFDILAVQGDESLARGSLTNARMLLLEVMKKGAPEMVNDVADDYRFTDSGDAAGGERNNQGVSVPKACLCSPILGQGGEDNVLGAVLLTHHSPREYAARDIKLLHCLACQAGMALQNGRRGQRTAKPTAPINPGQQPPTRKG